MKHALIASSLLLVSSSSMAAAITDTLSFGTQSSSTDVRIGRLNETLSVAGFDSSLGSLTDVSVTVRGQIDSSGTSQNNSQANGRADVGISLFQDWKVSSAAADDHIFAGADFVNPFLSAQSSPPGSFDMAPGDTFNYALSSGELSFDLQNIDINAFLAGGPVDFVFSAFANTVVGNDVASGTGFFTNSFQTGSWGEVEVTYTYDEIIAEVPEPGTLALLPLALLGLVASKRRKE